METAKAERKKRNDAARLNEAAPDRLPPHSQEAEQGVLGCILLSPDECLPLCQEAFRGRKDVFYDLRHAEIFKACKHLHAEMEPIDLITLQQHLKERNRLDEIGGLAYLGSLQDTVPSAANLSYYLEIVVEKYRLRKIVQTCGEVIDRIYDFNGDAADLMDELEWDIKSDLLKALDNTVAVGETFTWDDLIGFDSTNDPNCVVGFKDGKTTRYLCKGHSAWFIGPSGVGKSSHVFQMGVSFAANLPIWGIAPMRALRVLFIQAENDKGDMAEMAMGLRQRLGDNELDTDAIWENVRKNIRVRSVTGVIGEAFCNWLRREIVDFSADMVIVDPLLSFAGIDVSRQDQCSLFCRVWLDPILKETGAVLLSAHHTGKPKPENPKVVQTVYDQAYSGIGSSELVNWARAIILLQPAGGNCFRLVLAKRGPRAWATHPDGTFTTMLWLRHADNGIFWEQTNPPEEAEPEHKNGAKSGQPSKVNQIASTNLSGFCFGCSDEGEKLMQISARLEKFLAAENLDFSEKTCRRAIPRLVEIGKLSKGPDGLYRRGKNA